MTKIAIIGMGCRFPGRANNLENYWRLLCDEQCAISEIPPERWSLDGFFDPRPDIPTRSYSKWGGFLDDVSGFDPEFFGLTPREAAAMDPQQRLLLEVAYSATEDSGLTLDLLRKATTGVFVGASNTDYAFLQRHRFDRGEILAGTGTALSIVANRVSNALAFTGPSLVVDTACSSSLVALDTACHHLRSGSCDLAFAGGANILLDPRMFITFSRAHMLSPTGRIRAFDASADGFVRGEGAGLILLRRLEDAQANGDRIYAIVDATAVNQDGSTGTITAPNPDAQITMMRRARDLADIEPNQLRFAEAHGTGTAVGDPIEANAIGAVFGGRNRETPLLIGSSKSNLGHLEPAAGIAGLIKAALSLWHGKLPATLGYDAPNQFIDFEAHNLRVADNEQALPGNADDSFALVNSFGFGGTNACALLRSAELEKTRQPTFVSDAPLWAMPYPISGPTDRHMRKYAAALEEDAGTFSCDELGSALAHQRDHFKSRGVVVARDRHELSEKLAAAASDTSWPREHKYDPPGIVTRAGDAKGKLAFTMTGQGGQWWAMGRGLLIHHKSFRSFFEAFDEKFEPISGWSVIDALMADEADSKIDDAAITPAVMFCFQCGLAEIWKGYGVTPDLVVGHSFGEVTAAYLAGAISIDHVAKLVTHRGLIRGEVDRVGNMAAIGLGAEAMARLLPPDGSVEIGGYNSPNLVTLTGEEAAIDEIIAKLNRDDPTIVTKKLALDFAYHSSWFAPVEDIFKSNVGDLTWDAPRIPVVSTVTGVENTTFDADYWWSNLRYPVRYQDGINRALDLGARTFIELGPARTLSSMTAGCAAAKGIETETISTLHRGWDDFESIATAVGELFCAGHSIDWTGAHARPNGGRLLPHQPLLKSKFWSEPDEAERRLRPDAGHQLLGVASNGPGQNWSQTISLETHGFLSDHRINGQIVYPAACYIEMIYAAAAETFSVSTIEIKDLECIAALYIAPGDEIELQTGFDEKSGRVEIHSRHRNSGQGWRLRARARVLQADENGHSFAMDAELTGDIIDAFYEKASTLGYQYGTNFQGLGRVVCEDAAASGQLTNANAEPSALDDLMLPPRLLDSALQLMLAPQLTVTDATNSNGQFLPTRLNSIVITGSLRPAQWVQVKTHEDESRGKLTADFVVTDLQGEVCLSIKGLGALATFNETNVPTDGQKPTFYVERLEHWEGDEAASSTLQPWLIVEAGEVRVTSDPGEELANWGHEPNDAPLRQLGLEQQTEAFVTAISETMADYPEVKGLLYLPPVSNESALASSDDICRTTAGMIAFGRAIQNLSQTIGPRPIWLAMLRAREFVNVLNSDPVRLDHAALTGCARTIQMECPSQKFRLLDLDWTSLPHRDVLQRVLNSQSTETEFVVRDGTAHTVRLEACDSHIKARAFPARVLPDDTNRVLRTSGKSGLNSLLWEACGSPVSEDDGDITVEVTHAGLNFRDIMAANHALPDDAEPTPAIDALGLEFAGHVVSAGSRDAKFAVGERVFGMARGALAHRIKLRPDQVYRFPDGVASQDAATLCSAYLTAHYALNQIGRVQRGERVLIHNGSGAVGLAAIALCKAAGAEIFATAGNAAKRAHLKGLGVNHVFDSRTLAFSSDILQLTNGYGVDIVLNALSGPYIDKALDCLAPYGRFLEIGKRDVYADRPVGLRSLRSNQSLHIIDVAALLQDRPAHVQNLMDELTPKFSSGALPTLPCKVFPASETVEAFQYFSSAQHIGKVVVDCTDANVSVHRPFEAGCGADPDGTYLVTGGTRGMGLTISKWLADQGAGLVIAASQSGQGDELPPKYGAIEFRKLDVADDEAVDKILSEIQTSGLPLKGVVHAAVRYDDAILGDMTDEAIGNVVAPKVQGALNLTNAILAYGVKPDFFVSFSSAAQTTGWPGQSNYTAANSALESITYWQRHQGLHAQCVHWGVFGEVGHVAESAALTSYLSNAGWESLDSEVVCDSLARLLDSDEPVLTVMSADWPALSRLHSPIATSARLAELCESDDTDGGKTAFLTRAKNGDATALAYAIVREQVGKVLRVDPDDLHDCETIYDAGIDSLSAFELRNRIEQEIGLEIPLGGFIAAVRFDELSELLCELAKETQTQISSAPQNQHQSQAAE